MGKKKKMRFLLLQGCHYHEKVRYDSKAASRQDRIIETDVDLVKSFGTERFRLLENEKSKPKTEPKPEDVVVDDEKTETDVNPDPESGETTEAGDGEDGEDKVPVITLKAQHIGGGRYNVVKVVDGEDTGECVNDENLDKEEAESLVEAGWQG